MESDELFEPSKKKLRSSPLSERLQDPIFQELFQNIWHANESIKMPDFEIISQPFRVCRISNFLNSESHINEVKDELLDVKTRRNCIDLYQFEQSEDLANATSKNIELLYKAFETELASWMQRNLKIDLNGKMSMSSACYSDTDYLLCHDDNLGDRRIAFVLYLSKNWAKEDGGSLDLFDTDENNLPRNVVRSLVPEYNSLVFFEVTDNSFHQVAEVSSLDKSRWTINGWFHGPMPKVKRRRRPTPVYQSFEPEETEVDLGSWISKTYLIQDIVEEIQKSMEQDSFIYLPSFLISEKCRRIEEEIMGSGIRWEKVGPADVRKYEVANYESLPESLRGLLDMFRSVHMFHLLKQYTELDLVPENEDMKPRMRIELQRWSHACYTLIDDKHLEINEQSVEEDEEKRDRNENEAARSSFMVREEERMTSTDEEDEENFVFNAKRAKCKNYERGGRKLGSRKDDTVKRVVNTYEQDEEANRLERLKTDRNINIKREERGLESAHKRQEKNDPFTAEDEKNKNVERSSSADDGTRLTADSVKNADKRDEKTDQKNNSKGEGNSKTNIRDAMGIEASSSRVENTKDEAPRGERSGKVTKSSETTDRNIGNLKSSKGKGKAVVSPYKISHGRSIDTDDSEVSDIGDYLSDSQYDSDVESSETEVESFDEKPGTLDVLLQFHTINAPEDATVDYVVPLQKEGALIHVPPQDNHLCLVYRTAETSRCNKYVDHYCKGYFYTLACSYYE